MQWRCFSCGLKFADGVPPLEVLTLQQKGIVGADVIHAPVPISRFDGMSRGSFCEVCLLIMDSYPLIFERDLDIKNYIIDVRYRDRKKQDWIYINQAAMVRAIVLVYGEPVRWETPYKEIANIMIHQARERR